MDAAAQIITARYLTDPCLTSHDCTIALLSYKFTTESQVHNLPSAFP